jgi:hypothetical protein
VRGGPEWRQLSFRASGLTIELEITGSGDFRRLIGQLIPRQSAVVDIRHGHGVISVEADPLGRFSAEEVPFGQVSLRCRLGSDQAPIVTGWISLLAGGSHVLCGKQRRAGVNWHRLIPGHTAAQGGTWHTGCETPGFSRLMPSCTPGRASGCVRLSGRSAFYCRFP